jgi:hypothetical protein
MLVSSVPTSARSAEDRDREMRGVAVAATSRVIDMFLRYRMRFLPVPLVVVVGLAVVAPSVWRYALLALAAASFGGLGLFERLVRGHSHANSDAWTSPGRCRAPRLFVRRPRRDRAPRRPHERGTLCAAPCAARE